MLGAHALVQVPKKLRSTVAKPTLIRGGGLRQVADKISQLWRRRQTANMKQTQNVYLCFERENRTTEQNMEHPAEKDPVRREASSCDGSYGVVRTVKFSLSFDEDPWQKKIKPLKLLIAVISVSSCTGSQLART